MKVITISGHAGHGKDTTARFIKNTLECFGNKVLITHYADLLKYICKTYLGWDGQKDERGRTLLQHIGTDIVRNENPDYWVDFMIFVLGLSADKWNYVIIPDTRFPNEISRLRQDGFDVLHIRVERPRFENNLTSNQSIHQSETSLDEIIPDFTLLNDSTIFKFQKNIRKWTEDNLL